MRGAPRTHWTQLASEGSIGSPCNHDAVFSPWHIKLLVNIVSHLVLMASLAGWSFM